MNTDFVRRLICVIAGVLLVLSAPVAFAGNGKNKHHKLKEEDYASSGFKFSQHDERVIQKYLAGKYLKKCPPGLAKKRNGCMPPGQAKKQYRVGRKLGNVKYEMLPETLFQHLDPVPLGYKYVLVDKDVLLISEATHKVIDAITLLSAVGK